MSPDESEIRHVSDTALLVAACRALETARPDGLVRDPFAQLLAGERGMAIARDYARREILCFGVGIRSRFLDELVADTVAARRIQTVLSLGAGLDTRPWRLDLPPRLRWIEVDFPDMLEYKAGVMAGQSPGCALERIPADLNDAGGRASVWGALGGAPALMITEGLLMYLPAGTVESVAAESRDSGAVTTWLLDLATPEMARRSGMDSDESIQRVRAQGHLDGNRLLEVLARHGWTSLCHRSYTKDAWEAAQERILALATARALPAQPTPPPVNDPSGVHLFGRE